jgi:hypothetical protein
MPPQKPVNEDRTLRFEYLTVGREILIEGVL